MHNNKSLTVCSQSIETKSTALTAISDSAWEECVYFGLSLLSLSLSSSPSHNSEIQAGPMWVAMVTGREMSHVIKREKQSRPWPLLPSFPLAYKENLPCEDTIGVERGGCGNPRKIRG